MVKPCSFEIKVLLLQWILSQITKEFVTKLIKIMNSIASKIEQQINRLRKGQIFFSDDFTSKGSSDVVRQTLTRLCKDQKIIRLAQGIYCKPNVETKLGLGVILPSFEEIAGAMAKRDKARIVPTGIHALNVLGLSTQVPMNYVYFTDGFSRHVQMANGRGITFKQIAPRNFAFKNHTAMLITFALRSLKQENVEAEHIQRIHELLQNEPKETIINDLPLMPEWIRKIVLSAYE